MTDPEETHLCDQYRAIEKTPPSYDTNQYETDTLFLLSHLSQEKQ